MGLGGISSHALVFCKNSRSRINLVKRVTEPRGSNIARLLKGTPQQVLPPGFILNLTGREVRPPSCLGTQGWPLVVQHGACLTDRMVTEEGGEVKAPLPAVESRGPASPAHSAKESRGDTASDGSEEDTPVYMHVSGAARLLAGRRRLGGFTLASSLEYPSDTPPPLLPNCQATSFAVQQEDETWELPPFLNHVDKPMLEMQVGRCERMAEASQPQADEGTGFS